MNKEVRHIISQLKKHEICIRDIPHEYREDSNIITIERKLGLRKPYRCGYDVISDHFFVEEEVLYRTEEWGWSQLDPIYFDSFAAYSDYLNGNIYENACYFLMDPGKAPDDIDIDKLYEKDSFIKHQLTDYKLSPTDDEQAQYNKSEKRKTQVKKWIEKFNKCSTFQELKSTVQNYKKSTLCNEVDVSFYFWNYIFADVNDTARFMAIMEYMSSGIYPAYKICKALCAVYNPDDVVQNYKFELGSYQTCRKHIRAMKQVAENIKSGQYDYTRKGFFDGDTHFYCIETKAYEQGSDWPVFSLLQYFDTITAFIDCLGGDLSSCDLSKAQDVQIDYSKCTIDSTTKLPINYNETYDYTIKKLYRNGVFKVIQAWKNKQGCIVKSYEHKFEYFCDFIAFLNGDLSNADLVSCDGLDHIKPTDKISLNGALITSDICQKWNIPYNYYEVDAPPEVSFGSTEKNETETALVLHSSRELIVSDDKDGLIPYEPYDSPTKRIYYISDIHLYHLLKNKKAKSKPDIIKIIRGLVSTIINESSRDSIILINGDTSLNISIFKLFVSELGRNDRTVVFTLGNHDIWSCPDDTFDQLSEKYRDILKANDMYLLQNDVLYFTSFDQPPKSISEQEIVDLTDQELRDRVKFARLILFGGTGFAGYNQFFNAETGLYRYNNTIGHSREIEIRETRRFESLYEKICKSFYGKNTIIMTHMPLPDWYGPAWEHDESKYSNEVKYRIDHPEDNVGTYSAYHPGFVYVSGHTHRNYYYDDGEIRIYADNQFGYNNKTPSAWPHLKYFEVEKAIDIFSDYHDGIYEITADEYRQFYRGKNIIMDFNRETNVIYMLKKDGHYCFIHKAKNKSLSIMNGGALRHLDSKDINYYYDNMIFVIALIKDPLDKYTAYQKKVSEEIKKLGGYGSIHGCIVDIDFFNHVYVNPTDGTITGYWASDIINKLIYPTIPALLEAQCPRLFAAYNKMIKGEVKKNLPAISGQSESQLALSPVPYLDTDIYRASRQIKKMQKLNSNILSTWPDKLPQRKMLQEK